MKHADHGQALESISRNLSQSHTASPLGSLVLLVGEAKTNGFAGLDHLGANFHFFLVVANHDGNSLQVWKNSAVGPAMRV